MARNGEEWTGGQFAAEVETEGPGERGSDRQLDAEGATQKRSVAASAESSVLAHGDVDMTPMTAGNGSTGQSE